MSKNWRRGQSKNQGVTQNNTLPRRLTDEYHMLGTWEAVALKFGITKAMAYRVAHGYEPKTTRIRALLGLPCYSPALVCPVHGVVHQGQCPKKRKPPQSLFDWPIRQLARAIRERKEVR